MSKHTLFSMLLQVENENAGAKEKLNYETKNKNAIKKAKYVRLHEGRCLT